MPLIPSGLHNIRSKGDGIACWVRIDDKYYAKYAGCEEFGSAVYVLNLRNIRPISNTNGIAIAHIVFLPTIARNADLLSVHLKPWD